MKVSGAQIFSVFIRIVFLFAFGAFLSASIHHIAAFYSGFEPTGAIDAQSYTLAISIDFTALVLTVGVMFFSERMPGYARFFIWAFIVALTGFSWVVNWQYAVTYQQPNGLTSHLDPVWQNINPILASSFAFLNLAYALVSEFFSAKKKTAAELQAELDALNETADLEKQLREKKEQASGPGLIHRLKETAKEIKEAAKEVIGETVNETGNVTPKETKPETSPETGNDNDLETDSETIAETENVNLWETDDETEMETTPETSGVIHRETTTGELPAIPVSLERDTDEIKVSSKRPRKAKQIVSTKEQEVRRLLRKRPTMTATEIAEKVGVSRQYVGQIKRSLELAS